MTSNRAKQRQTDWEKGPALTDLVWELADARSAKLLDYPSIVADVLQHGPGHGDSTGPRRGAANSGLGTGGFLPHAGTAELVTEYGSIALVNFVQCRACFVEYDCLSRASSFQGGGAARRELEKKRKVPPDFMRC